MYRSQVLLWLHSFPRLLRRMYHDFWQVSNKRVTRSAYFLQHLEESNSGIYDNLY